MYCLNTFICIINISKTVYSLHLELYKNMCSILFFRHNKSLSTPLLQINIILYVKVTVVRFVWTRFLLLKINKRWNTYLFFVRFAKSLFAYSPNVWVWMTSWRSNTKWSRHINISLAVRRRHKLLLPPIKLQTTSSDGCRYEFITTTKKLTGPRALTR